MLNHGRVGSVLKLEPRDRGEHKVSTCCKRAREYRLKYAHKSADPLTEARVQAALSLGEKK